MYSPAKANELFKELLAEISCSWRYVLSFTRFLTLKIDFSFGIFHSKLLTVLEQWTCFHRISYVSYLGYKFRHTIRYNTKLCENWGLFTLHSNSRAQGKYLCSVGSVVCSCIPLYANKLFWFRGVFTIVSETVLAITFYHSENRFQKYGNSPNVSFLESFS